MSPFISYYLILLGGLDWIGFLSGREMTLGMNNEPNPVSIPCENSMMNCISFPVLFEWNELVLHRLLLLVTRCAVSLASAVQLCVRLVVIKMECIPSIKHLLRNYRLIWPKFCIVWWSWSVRGNTGQ